MTEWLHPANTTMIFRDSYISIYKEEELCFDIPLSAGFSDKQITAIISIVNDVFRKGFKQGELAKIHSFKQMFNLL